MFRDTADVLRDIAKGVQVKLGLMVKFLVNARSTRRFQDFALVPTGGLKLKVLV